MEDFEYASLYKAHIRSMSDLCLLQEEDMRSHTNEMGNKLPTELAGSETIGAMIYAEMVDRWKRSI